MTEKSFQRSPLPGVAGPSYATHGSPVHRNPSQGIDETLHDQIRRDVQMGYGLDDLCEMYCASRESMCSFLATLPDDEPEYEDFDDRTPLERDVEPR